ncbi:Phosphoglycerate mutase [Paramagnetospirillum magnetotacticum MS-1]|uniref:phosphoglycerate mutase (2,3-diphosphoglycerate-dependent) n=1 Tax=Paramagnetospirillum magnetotacticum MS-1 TaxID=272627 RepID=A0A0C2V558_PARME|nr:histidine phosphatase family protein [Paramagnetospirillum magnetotacticum]KIM00192.1 Phosphoglycerate mutase [Paramagnetospirillum magnetotacticum MS-1]
MTVFLVRHGQSEGNRDVVFSGLSDHPLTPLGRAQAAEAGRSLLGLRFAHVLTSCLSRAVETCDLLLAASGSEVGNRRRLERLNERNFGVFEGNADDSATLAADPIRRSVAYDVAYRPEGGESMLDCLERSVICFEADILPLAVDGHVLVVTHGNVVRSLALYHLGWPVDMLPEMPSRNCLITRIEPLGWVKPARTARWPGGSHP